MPTCTNTFRSNGIPYTPDEAPGNIARRRHGSVQQISSSVFCETRVNSGTIYWQGSLLVTTSAYDDHAAASTYMMRRSSLFFGCILAAVVFCPVQHGAICPVCQHGVWTRSVSWGLQSCVVAWQQRFCERTKRLHVIRLDGVNAPCSPLANLGGHGAESLLGDRFPSRAPLAQASALQFVCDNACVELRSLSI